MSSVVYHFTDTARLPWILYSGELRPGRNRIGGYPDPDFLWATSNPRGSRKAAASMQAYRSGTTRLVRFILPADAFEPWRTVVQRYPQWTQHHIDRLERSGGEPPTLWQCRKDSLPQSSWIKIETKSFTDGSWSLLPTQTEAVQVTTPDAAIQDTLGLVINGKAYLSRRCEQSTGPVSYNVWTLDGDAWNAGVLQEAGETHA